MLKIKKSTIVRTILLVIVLLNMILKALGHPVIEVDEGSIGEFVELVIEIAVLILNWWKNNSFSQSAIKSDEYLEMLRNLED